MVSAKKQAWLKVLQKELEQYKVIGMLDMYKLPARQLMEIREALRGKAVIKMYKKCLITLALSKKPGMADMAGSVGRIPALLFSNENPFSLAKVISESKSMASAKSGDTTANDIVVRGGLTELAAGPVIGELQRAKIPATVKDGKIEIRQDTVVAKAGSTIDGNLANILAKLKVKPMEIGLNLVCAYEDGHIYQRDILFKPRQTYINEMQQAFRNYMGLSLNLGIPTKDNIKMLLSKAHGEAFGLAMEAGFVTEETTKPLLSKGHAQAESLKAAAKLDQQGIGGQQPEEKKS